MLYKKYHRNFVREFKIGVEFRCYVSPSVYTAYVVEKEPYYNERSRCIEFRSNSYFSRWTLINLDAGSINNSIKVVDAIQKIS